MSFIQGATRFLEDYTFGLALTGLGVSVLGLLWALYLRVINTWALGRGRWGAVQCAGRELLRNLPSGLKKRNTLLLIRTTGSGDWEGYSLAHTQLSDDSIAEPRVQSTHEACVSLIFYGQQDASIWRWSGCDVCLKRKERM